MTFSECSNYIIHCPLIKFNLLIVWQSLYCQCSIGKFQQRRKDKHDIIEINERSMVCSTTCCFQFAMRSIQLLYYGILVLWYILLIIILFLCGNKYYPKQTIIL